METSSLPRSYYRVWAAIHLAAKKIGLDSKIQPCHGLRKYFENALDEASIDHERKMVIEGHIAGTRAKHYTDRDIEQLREVYGKAYPYIKLDVVEPSQHKTETRTYSRRFTELEARLERQRVLEAKLMVLEDRVDRFLSSVRK